MFYSWKANVSIHPFWKIIYFVFSILLMRMAGNCKLYNDRQQGTLERFARHLSALSAIILQMRWNELNYRS